MHVCALLCRPRIRPLQPMERSRLLWHCVARALCGFSRPVAGRSRWHMARVGTSREPGTRSVPLATRLAARSEDCGLAHCNPRAHGPVGARGWGGAYRPGDADAEGRDEICRISGVSEPWRRRGQGLADPGGVWPSTTTVVRKRENFNDAHHSINEPQDDGQS